MSKAKPKRIELTCEECHKKFHVSGKDWHRKYCSAECYRKQYKRPNRTGLKFGRLETGEYLKDRLELDK